MASLYAMEYKPDEILKLFNYFSKEALGIGAKSFFSNVKNGKGIKIKGITSSLNLEIAIR